VEYEDRITIQTPEGVELELVLAGLGSRFVGALIDLTLKFLVIGLLAAVLGVLGLFGVAALFALSFLVLFAYDVLFETLAGGRTPGKRAAGTRVVRAGGEPVDFTSSAIRNVLRVVDGIPTSYIPGMVSIIATRRNQRLGDLAAGTLVVMERKAEPADAPPSYMPPAHAAPAPAWDVSAVTGEELAAVRSFLSRRAGLEPTARQRIANELAVALQHKVAGAERTVHPEQFLEQLAYEKSLRG
jgi:uncharacterized RDD family membrane protein YckC